MQHRQQIAETQNQAYLPAETEAAQVGDGLRHSPVTGRYDPLAQVTNGPGTAEAATAHAARLSRLTARSRQQSGPALRQLQRRYGNQYVQRLLALTKKSSDAEEAAPASEETIRQARGSGQALDSQVRTQMQRSFGASFGGVRIHTDARADRLSRALNAKAFTTGRDIFFRQGAYNPGSAGGRELIAHELTHVLQQTGGQLQAKLVVGQPDDRYEREADRVAQMVVQTGRNPATVNTQHQEDEEEKTEVAGQSAGGLIQRNGLGDLWSGVQELGGRALGGLQSLGASTLSGLRRLGSGVMETLEQMGQAALEWGPRLAAIAANPMGALTGGLWLAMPDRLKPPLINTILDFADSILARLRGMWSVVIGPLWPLISSFMLGFIRRMRQVPDNLKIALSNRLANLMTGGSLTFMLHFVKGLALGVWDIIRLPYDLIVLAIDGVQMIGRFVDNLTHEDFEEGANLMGTSLSAAWAGLGDMVRNPRQAFRFIETIWNSISQAVGQMGRGLAQMLIDIFRLPDAQFGEEAGRIAVGIAIDVVLTFFTAGAGALLRQATSAVGRFVRLFRAGARFLRRAMQVARSVVNPLINGVRRLGRLFTRGRFGRWLGRFGTWLDRLLTALDIGVTGAMLQQAGAEPTEASEAAASGAGFELSVVGESIRLVPEQVSGSGLIQRNGGGSGTSTPPIHLPSGDEFEGAVTDMLRRGDVPGTPPMNHVIPGQHNRVHGMDLIGIHHAGNGELWIYIIEVKGGGAHPDFPVGLGQTRHGMQMGGGWRADKIDRFLRNPTRRNQLQRVLRQYNHNTDLGYLRGRLLRAPGRIVVHEGINLARIGRQVGAIAPHLGHHRTPRIVSVRIP